MFFFIVVIYVLANQDLFGANVDQYLQFFKFFFRSRTHQTSSTKKPREFGLKNFQFCELFVGFLWIFPAQTFPLSVNTLHIALFPFQSTCILLPCPYYSPLMHLRSCQRYLLCILKVLDPLFCVWRLPSVLLPRLVFKTFLYCDNLRENANYMEIKTSTNKFHWEKTSWD